MDYSVMSVSPSEVTGLVSEDIRMWLDASDGRFQDLMMICAEEGDVSVGYALLCALQPYAKSYELIYSYVAADLRGRGYGRDLISYCVRYIKETLHCRCMVILEDNEMDSAEFLEDCGLEFYSSMHMMLYTVGDLRKSMMANHLPDLKKLMKNTASYQELEKTHKLELEHFRKELVRSRLDVSYSQLDSKYTRFFTDMGNILGYLAFISNRTCIYMLDNYIADSPKTKLAVPAMLASLLEETLKNGNDDVMVILFFKSRAHSEAVLTAFGDPIEECQYNYFI